MTQPNLESQPWASEGDGLPPLERISLEHVKYLSDLSTPTSLAPASPMMAFSRGGTTAGDSDLNQSRRSSLVSMARRDGTELGLEECTEETTKALLARICRPKDGDDQQLAAELLCNTVADIASQELVVAQGGIPVLVTLLKSRAVSAETHLAAACALQNLSCKAAGPTSKAQIAAEGPEALVAFLDDGPAQYAQSVLPVLRVLRSLANDRDDAVKRRLVAAGAVATLVSTIGGAAPDESKVLAAAAIRSLSFVSGRMVQDYPAAVATLTNVLTTSPDVDIRRCLMGTLQNFSVYSAAHLGPSIPAFVRLLRSSVAEAEECAALVLHNLAAEKHYTDRITEAQAVPELVLVVRRDGVCVCRRKYMFCWHWPHSHRPR